MLMSCVFFSLSSLSLFTILSFIFCLITPSIFYSFSCLNYPIWIILIYFMRCFTSWIEDLHIFLLLTLLCHCYYPNHLTSEIGSSWTLVSDESDFLYRALSLTLFNDKKCFRLFVSSKSPGIYSNICVFSFDNTFSEVEF